MARKKERMPRPSWNDAPIWAQYLAMDDNGDWYWFQVMPGFDRETGRWVLMQIEPNLHLLADANTVHYDALMSLEIMTNNTAVPLDGGRP